MSSILFVVKKYAILEATYIKVDFMAYSSDDSTVAKEIPSNLNLFFWLMFIIPIPFALIFTVYTKMLSFADVFAMNTSWYIILYIIVYFGSAFLLNRYVMNTVSNFSGKDEDIDSCNSIANMFGPLNIVLLLANTFVYSILSMLAAHSRHIETFEFFPFFMIYIGFTFMLSVFVYVFWIETYEGWLNFLPFREKDLQFTLIGRNGLVAAFTAIGLFCIILSPMMMKVNEEVPMKTMITTTLLPVIIFGIIIDVVDFLLITRGVVRRLGFISDFSKTLATGDYTSEDLQVVSRDEFGLLVNYLNNFFSQTKGILA